MKRKCTSAVILAFCAVLGCSGTAFAQEGYGPGYTSDGRELGQQPGNIYDGGTETGGVQEAGDSQAAGGAQETGNSQATAGTPGPGGSQSEGAPGTGSSVVQAVQNYTFEQMTSDIRSLQAKYKSFLSVNVIGKSADGRDIYELVVGSPRAARHVLIQSGIHGREHMTSLLVMKQVEEALYSYNGSAPDGRSFSRMFDQTALHFIPMSNPDGVAISQSGAGALRSEELRNGLRACYEADHAEGRTPYPFEQYLTYWKANARGVDLNRNFDAAWQEVGSPAHASCGGFKGLTPFTEPESQALRQLASGRDWAATVSYHAMGEVVYWDCAGNRQTDPSLELARLVSSATGYPLAASASLGGFKDWMQVKENPAASVTIEVGTGSCPLPVSQFEKIWAQNREIWKKALSYAYDRGM